MRDVDMLNYIPGRGARKYGDLAGYEVLVNSNWEGA